VWRLCCDARQMDLSYPEGVGRPESRSHVVHASHIIQDNTKWKLGCRLKVVDGHAA
jgi:hypothetical protein